MNNDWLVYLINAHTFKKCVSCQGYFKLKKKKILSEISEIKIALILHVSSYSTIVYYVMLSVMLLMKINH